MEIMIGEGVESEVDPYTGHMVRKAGRSKILLSKTGQVQPDAWAKQGRGGRKLVYWNHSYTGRNCQNVQVVKYWAQDAGHHNKSLYKKRPMIELELTSDPG